MTSHWSVLSGAAATSPPPLKTRLEEHPEEVRFERYCRLLATELTDLQRQNLHKRIRALRAIRKEPDATVIDVVMETAAPATSKVNW